MLDFQTANLGTLTAHNRYYFGSFSDIHRYRFLLFGSNNKSDIGKSEV